MILFFESNEKAIYAVESSQSVPETDLTKISWLLGEATLLKIDVLEKTLIGPRSSMVSPWSTNAVEILQNMGIDYISRIEMFKQELSHYDQMLLQKYEKLDQSIFTVEIKPEPVLQVDDISAYNKLHGLALSSEEITYLENISKKLQRPLTDSEVFGFSQINSEHCRHKIFNGTFIIDGEKKDRSLFAWIKKTSNENPNEIVSAYKDNVAFIQGPHMTLLSPENAAQPSLYKNTSFESVLSLKAETHNFPTTVEPFNGAATGSGGEIRDRMAGGQGSIPMAGTAVYMTPYSRLYDELNISTSTRDWLYQTPTDILIKASNGASDFGNKFGQPLIAGSLLTFEHYENGKTIAFDKVIMLAGGVGFAKKSQAQKRKISKGDKIVILGGDNYRIGMGGASVSSIDTGKASKTIELNAIQRSNPEMQKRVANVVRAMVENKENYILSIHDHGAGGHLNCISELLEATGGKINMDQLPIGDKTLSLKEILGNESQERMGLIVPEEYLSTLEQIAARERAPMYVVGEVTEDHQLEFESLSQHVSPICVAISDLLGSSPITQMVDESIVQRFEDIQYDQKQIQTYVSQVLQLEAVACKDWLTNKVDRCVGGFVAKQQCAGPLQLPLNNVGVMALDHENAGGIATSIGHSPISGLIDPEKGSQNSIAEALTNIIWAPLTKGLAGVSLSANWMWPCKTPGEDARLYRAVQAASNFACDLGINIPTGKDSLSMKQKYENQEVSAPGTVIISAVAQVSALHKVVEPVFTLNQGPIYYINMSQDDYYLGGSSFAQIQNKIGTQTPGIRNISFFKKAFSFVQKLIADNQIVAGHDVSSGGLITTLLEMCFADTNLGATIDLTALGETDSVRLLFSENASLVFQTTQPIDDLISKENLTCIKIGEVVAQNNLNITNHDQHYSFDIPTFRKTWMKTSVALDTIQSGKVFAQKRFDNLDQQPLAYKFPNDFSGKRPTIPKRKIKAAILREKGSNSEREMANAMHMAGFDVLDVHMTDLIAGRETLESVSFIGAVGGFSNSDVLGSAKGWAGAFKYNPKANKALQNFFDRKNTLSVGICNGCQLFIELGLIHPEHDQKPKMLFNASNKFECRFTSVKILPNNSPMLSSLEGSTLGIWSAHGEGRFSFPLERQMYNIVGAFSYSDFPANPNGSQFDTAMLASEDGRHLVTMPHIERSIFPYNWAHYPLHQRNHEVSPWLQSFINAYQWLKDKND
ncbi:MAG: phosphoribosylformylglycinamidine synthase [Bdellovibrionales bacterium]|nr:phosphoribosylformylglycinamidine synthase [Bdellovibrionales bacterium]